MEKIIVGGGRVILPGGTRDDVSLILEDGKIQAVVPSSTAGAPDIDASGRYISPGFMDIHVHGGGGHDFMDGTVEAFLGAAKMHAAHGTTSMLPTSMTCSTEEQMQFFRTYREAKPLNTEGSEFLGIHMEGIFLSPQYAGAQDPSYLKPPVPENYMPFLEASDDIVRVSAAPELEGAEGLGNELRRRGILASIAHTGASAEQCREAHKAGFSLMTHLYCAMSSVVRKNAYRIAGAVEAAYLLDDMDVEIIADGKHLPESLLTFVYKFKGPSRTVLCTDAMRAAGMPEGESILGSLSNGQRVIVEDGVAKVPDRSTFAGSVATADRLVRTMMRLSPATLEEAVTMMTATPARVMGLSGKKGSIRMGMDADIVIFDDDINIYNTIIGGKVVYEG